MTIPGFGKIILVAGLIIALLGLILIVAGKGPFQWVGRLPGDFHFEGKNFSFYFPLSTCIVISIVLSFILWLINRK